MDVSSGNDPDGEPMRGGIWEKQLYLAGMQYPLPLLHFPTAVDLGAAWEIWDQGGEEKGHYKSRPHKMR